MQLIDLAEARGDEDLSFGGESLRTRLAGAQVGIQPVDSIARLRGRLGDAVENQIAAHDGGRGLRGAGREQGRRQQRQQKTPTHCFYVP